MPNFFIVGVARSGTTSLYAYLSDTPGVFMSTEKEPEYFHSHSAQSRKDRAIKQQSEYLKLFKGATDEKAIGEASPGYFKNPESAKLIHNAVPTAKIIILLRDPVEWAFSFYLWRRTKGTVEQSFHEMIIRNIENNKKGIVSELGMYTPSVKNFQDIFGIDRVKVLIFEEFIKETKKTVKGVLEFLGVDAEPPASIEKPYNVYRAPRGKLSQNILTNDRLVNISRHIIPQSLRWELREKFLFKKESKPKISKDDRHLLEQFFKSDIRELKILLKRDLPWNWIKTVS